MKKHFINTLIAAALAMPSLLSAGIIINEIQFDPAGGDNSTMPEWIELYNTDTTPINMSGYKATGGSFAAYTFPSGSTIQGQGYVLLVGGQEVKQFFASYDNGVDPAIVHKMSLGSTVGSKLGNSGATITIKDATDTTVATVTYAVVAPWPADPVNSGANSTGRTLELTNPSADYTDGANWKVSLSPIGTPGKPNSQAGNTRLTGGQRDLQYPSSTQPININATVVSTAANTTVTISVATGTNNQTYTTTAMTNTGGNNYSAQIGPFPDNTLVKYYIHVQDSEGYEVFYPTLAPRAPEAFFVTNTPVTKADLLINEIKYNAKTADENVTDSEYIEIYNLSANPIDISYYILGRSPDDTYRRRVPEGTIIPAGGYYVLAARIGAFENVFGTGLPVLDAAWPEKVSVLANGGSNTHIAHANAFEWNGVPTVPFDLVTYGDAAPWPASKDGFSIELMDAVTPLDNTNPASWATSISTVGGGTPGAYNSKADVQDWNLY